jgi:UDP:flavonoid glycosyltransferase YjiC (YdhE family)
MTGFCFYDGAQQANWQPDSRLREFVEQGDPPLVLCMGNLAAPDTREHVQTHVEAARLLEKKLVVQTGWALPGDGGWLENRDAEHVLFAEFLPHDWLFARAAAVVHHGGIGATARALKHGCPVLVEPYRKDQYFNASRVRQLGAGFAVDPTRATAAGVARVLAEKVTAPATRERAQRCAEQMAGEDGVGTACRYIEECLSAQRKG